MPQLNRKATPASIGAKAQARLIIKAIAVKPITISLDGRNPGGENGSRESAVRPSIRQFKIMPVRTRGIVTDKLCAAKAVTNIAVPLRIVSATRSDRLMTLVIRD
jgi:hypothetical protein